MEKHMKTISALTAAFVLFLATPSWAVQKPASTITVTVDDLNCTTALGAGTFGAQTWSFGATQSGGGSTGGGGGAGKATVSGLKVEKTFDQCSPGLFGGVTTGKHFRTVTLVQKDDKGTIMTVTLTDVIIASYNLAGSQTDRNPMEAVSFSFAKICINDSQSGTQACFDFASQTSN
jgi:type VI secretion system secreted protein Hcp